MPLCFNLLTYFIATPPYRGWHRSEGLSLLHSFLSLDIVLTSITIKHATSDEKRCKSIFWELMKVHRCFALLTHTHWWKWSFIILGKAALDQGLVMITVLVTLFKWVINPYCLSYPGSRVILSEFIEFGICTCFSSNWSCSTKSFCRKIFSRTAIFWYLNFPKLWPLIDFFAIIKSCW